MLGLLLLLSQPAHSNGQTTHLWITEHALEHLPEGELKQLLTREDVSDALRTGTMFPDGGYAYQPQLLYGEHAHWEPFQARYIDWIRANEPAPFTDEGAKHVAFLMGLASHGMADQIFDSLYMERSRHWDADHGWSGDVSFDEATDVVWAGLTGAQPVPEAWIPHDALVSLFSAHGAPIDADSLDDAQGRLGIAVNFVGLAGQNPDAVDDYAAEYPWGSAHLDDRDVPGSPRCEGEIVALYWADVYDRVVQGQTTDQLVMATLPRDGQMGHEPRMDLVESWVSIVSKRGLLRADVGAENFSIADAQGNEHPFEVWLFYRDNSHVVHLQPTADWAADTDYTVTVRPGLVAREGSTQGAPWSFGFSTRPAPDFSEGPDNDGEDPADGCACSNQGHPPGWLALGLLVMASWRRRCR